MTMRMVSHALYTCDGCGESRAAWSHEVPDGWVTENALIGGAVTHITRHLCAKCAAVAESVPPETP